LLALGKIWGVGPETARRLYGSGYASIDALRAAVAAEDIAGGKTTDPARRVLSHAQRVGLQHYGEFEEKMPRAEAAAIGALVRDAVDAACGPGRCRVTLAGSFRRGKQTCGDVDVLVAPSDAFATDASAGEGDGDGDDARALVAREPLSSSLGERRTLAPSNSRRYVDRLDDILPATLALLRKSGLITDDLNSGERRSYMGVCRLPPETRVTDREDETEGTLSHQKTETDARLGTASGTPAASPSPSRPHALPPRRFRRLDIKVYSPEEYPFALLYFTGSGYFNRSMRWWADKKFRGLSLGDKGFRLQSGARGSSFKHDPRFRGTTFSTEKDIFDFLKLRYVEPEDRCV
jgi:DNA polymerase/3'-5' exonuclease PolX